MHKTIPTHKDNIKQCFNRASATYDQASYPQQMIGHQLVEGLSKYGSSYSSIIDLGCGSGLVTEYLAKLVHYETFYAIDLSDNLIALANSRLESYGVRVRCDDFDLLSGQDKLFELVFSNLALHWSLDLRETLKSINHAIKDQGVLAFTVPLDGTFAELSKESRNSYLKLSEVEDILACVGFAPLNYRVETFTFGFDSWLKAMRSIKATGANYLFKKERYSLGGVGSLACLSSPSVLTYQVGFFIARKQQHVR